MSSSSARHNGTRAEVANERAVSGISAYCSEGDMIYADGDAGRSRALIQPAVNLALREERAGKAMSLLSAGLLKAAEFVAVRCRYKVKI